MVGILGNVAEVPEGVLSWASVVLTVSSQESGEARIIVDDSVGKAAGTSILEGNFGLYNLGGGAATFELGSDADVVKASTLVIDVLTESSLEHDLEFSVTVE